MIHRCERCPDPETAWEQDLPREKGEKALAAHRQLRHGIAPLEGVPQFPGVSWQSTFLEAVKRQPIGCELTTADLHALVPPPPHHNSWGSATAAAAHLGLIREIGRQPSELPTTKKSLVRRWVRTDPNAKGRTV